MTARSRRTLTPTSKMSGIHANPPPFTSISYQANRRTSAGACDDNKIRFATKGVCRETFFDLPFRSFSEPINTCDLRVVAPDAHGWCASSPHLLVAELAESFSPRMSCVAPCAGFTLGHEIFLNNSHCDIVLILQIYFYQTLSLRRTGRAGSFFFWFFF